MISAKKLLYKMIEKLAEIKNSYTTVTITTDEITSLPHTYSNANIKAYHTVVDAQLSSPSAQKSDWTVTFSDGSLTISGTMSSTEGASTTLTLKLAKGEAGVASTVKRPFVNEDWLVTGALYDTSTVNANSYITRSVSIAKEGYVPIGLLTLGKDGGSSIHCLPTYWRIDRNANTFDYALRNVGSASATVNVYCSILYMKSN